MTNSKKIKRKFSKPDSEMETQADSFEQQLVDDLNDFTTFRPSFNVGYVTAFHGEIVIARAATPPEIGRAQLTAITQQVDEKTAACVLLFADLMYSVKETFPKQPGMWKSFGSGLLTKARKSGGKMVSLLTVAHDAADENSAALIAKDYTQLKIDALGTEATALDVLCKAQEKKKADNRADEEDYVNKLNSVWGIMTVISKAAKRIYKDSPAHYRNYLLYPDSTSHVQNFSLDIPAGGFVSLALNHPLHIDTLLHMVNDGVTLLRICRSEIAAACGNIPPNEQGIPLNPGQLLDMNAGGLGVGEFLIVTNLDPALNGHITMVVTWV
ncbi:MAG: hypothetical protein NTX03_14280 [Bacteroidetes bacterium]|nr:hypothetical protein [Bacteroidota bacterium]